MSSRRCSSPAWTNSPPCIFSFGTFAAGYVARPLGGVIFGHFGDRLGRKKMLVLTMLIMGVASFLIGLVPGASAIGPWGAMILVLLRVARASRSAASGAARR